MNSQVRNLLAQAKEKGASLLIHMKDYDFITRIEMRGLDRRECIDINSPLPNAYKVIEEKIKSWASV